MRVLDLGCATNRLSGKEKYKNYSLKGEVIGLDYIKSDNVDVVCNLEKDKIPFKDNSFDIVYAHHCIEHLENTFQVIYEVWRILKKGGRLLMAVPHASALDNFAELTHKKRFGHNSMDCFDINKKEKYDYQVKNKSIFRIVRKKINFGRFYRILGIEELANKFPRIYEGYYSWMFPAREMIYELEKV